MAEELIMPTLGLTMTEGTVDQWYKQVGDKVAKGEAVVSISSEKLTHDVESPINGVLLKISVEAGGEAACKAPIGYVGEAGEIVSDTNSSQPVAEVVSTPASTVAEKKEKAPVIPNENSNNRIFATPLARKIAKEKGYDLADIVGTGGNGRITRLDVNRFVPAAVKEITAAVSSGDGLTGMRKVIAQRMHQSLQQTAQLTIQRKADITDLLLFKKELKEKAGDSVKRQALSINTLIIKAAALALVDHPEMNAWYDGKELTVVDKVNIGVAVSVDDGLVVPVLNDVHYKSLTQIGNDFSDVTAKAVDGTLPSDLYTGSTFTITNLGNLGVEYFTPILNTPEIGILGIGSSNNKLTMTNDGELTEITELPLSLTFDHQVIDGTPAAEFLANIVYYLENPYALIV
ncbi:dihydrolipoamide acetyltransferase family protein [Vagococcus vulneris]|uniref:Dihydrolipoamide acetyltransferase component of pyruvate dehydrogenase complex n=1 Tax=Vagococcus vulneris TaxID=1977869 RepID=A0A430A1I4_9ENTE|nr:dihydrolipoamide acetyltransferase family protein [Vagococcus vulneris]RSU00256.1 branched-chain alpha-keto acid dehydrogenase subunit E2 [Vagococcus vulneris]